MLLEEGEVWMIHVLNSRMGSVDDRDGLFRILDVVKKLGVPGNLHTCSSHY